MEASCPMTPAFSTTKKPTLLTTRWSAFALQLTAVITAGLFLNACSAGSNSSSDDSSNATAQDPGASLATLLAEFDKVAYQNTVECGKAYWWIYNTTILSALVAGQVPNSTIKDRLGNVLFRIRDLNSIPQDQWVTKVRNVMEDADENFAGLRAKNALGVSSVACPTMSQMSADFQKIDGGKIFADAVGKLGAYYANEANNAAAWAGGVAGSAVQWTTDRMGDIINNPVFQSIGAMAAVVPVLGYASQGATLTGGAAGGAALTEALGGIGVAISSASAAAVLTVVGWVLAALATIAAVVGLGDATLRLQEYTTAGTIAALAVAMRGAVMSQLATQVFSVPANTQLILAATGQAINEVTDWTVPAVETIAGTEWYFARSRPSPSATRVTRNARVGRRLPASRPRSGGGADSPEPPEPPQNWFQKHKEALLVTGVTSLIIGPVAAVFSAEANDWIESFKVTLQMGYPFYDIPMMWHVYLDRSTKEVNSANLLDQTMKDQAKQIDAAAGKAVVDEIRATTVLTYNIQAEQAAAGKAVADESKAQSAVVPLPDDWADLFSKSPVTVTVVETPASSSSP